MSTEVASAVSGPPVPHDLLEDGMGNKCAPLFSADRDFIQYTIDHATRYRGEIDPEQIYQMNKQVQNTDNYNVFANQKTTDLIMLIKYNNLLSYTPKVHRLIQKKSRTVDDFMFLMNWISLQFQGFKYIQSDWMNQDDGEYDPEIHG